MCHGLDLCTTTIQQNPDNKRVDLVSWIAMNKDELVLKPSHDFGGHGVTLVVGGVHASEWEAKAQISS